MIPNLKELHDYVEKAWSAYEVGDSGTLRNCLTRLREILKPYGNPNIEPAEKTDADAQMPAPPFPPPPRKLQQD